MISLQKRRRPSTSPPNSSVLVFILFVANWNDGALPGEDYVEFGRDYEESVEIAQYLEKIGYVALDVDNGTYDSWFWPHPPVYMPEYLNLEDAAFIKRHVNIPVFYAGKMIDPEVCDQAIADGKIDGVAMARNLLLEEHRHSSSSSCFEQNNA